MASRDFWSGWAGFAGLVLIMIGTVNVIEGLVALFDDQQYVVTKAGLVALDFTTWGWLLLAWGALLTLAGLGLLARSGWARWFTIVLVIVNLIGQFGFHAAQPLWTVTVIAMEVLVLYALTVRWSDVEATV